MSIRQLEILKNLRWWTKGFHEEITAYKLVSDIIINGTKRSKIKQQTQ